MKNFILIFSLLFTSCLHAMVANKPFLTLISQEGDAVTVPFQVAENSPVLKDLIEESEEVSKPTPIPVLIKLKDLKLLIKGMRIKDDNSRRLIEKLIKGLGLKNIKDKNGNLDLISLFDGAHYLHLETVEKAIAHAYVEDPNFKKYVDEIKKKIEASKESGEKPENLLLVRLLDKMAEAYLLENGKNYEDLPENEPGIDELVDWKDIDLAKNRSLEIYSLLKENKIDQAKRLLEKRGNALFFSYCRLGSIPSSIGKLINLKKLDLTNNLLEELPEEMSKLTKLEQLDLSQQI